MSALKTFKLMCCFKPSGDKTDQVEPKTKRKFSLSSVTRSGSKTSIESHFQNLLKEVRKAQDVNSKFPIDPQTQDDAWKLELRIIRELNSAKEKLKQKQERQKTNLQKRFLRQQINQLRHKRDFQEFMKNIDIGNVDWLESISDSESDQEPVSLNEAGESWLGVSVENVFTNKPVLDINKAFKLVDTPESRSRLSHKHSSKTKSTSVWSKERSVATSWVSQDTVPNKIHKRNLFTPSKDPKQSSEKDGSFRAFSGL